MKHSSKLLTLISVIALLASCAKSDFQITPLASINIINATVGSTPVKANFTNNSNIFTGTVLSVAYGANNAYALPAGTATPVTILASADTLHPIYTTPINAPNGSYYSLYLCGQTGAVESVLKQENFTVHQDSTFSVRLVNLSYNSGPINMTLSTSITTNEIAGIAYKAVSDFKNYPATYKNTSYTFQLRDATTNALLGSQAYTTAASMPRFQNITLVLKGAVGGTGANALGLQLVKNF